MFYGTMVFYIIDSETLVNKLNYYDKDIMYTDKHYNVLY